MKLKIKKIFSVLVVSFICVSAAFSASAKVTFVKGTVEVNRRNTWVPVKVGDLISESETISTGFQSEARLNLNGSILAVAALTRVKIETLKTSDSGDNVALYQDVGVTRSKVNHTNNKRINYSTRTAVAVASVRGTDYTIRSNGKLRTGQGSVGYSSNKSYSKIMASGKAGSMPADTIYVNKGQYGIMNNGFMKKSTKIISKKRKMQKGVKTASENDKSSYKFFNDKPEKSWELRVIVIQK